MAREGVAVRDSKRGDRNAMVGKGCSGSYGHPGDWHGQDRTGRNGLESIGQCRLGRAWLKILGPDWLQGDGRQMSGSDWVGVEGP